MFGNLLASHNKLIGIELANEKAGEILAGVKVVLRGDLVPAGGHVLTSLPRKSLWAAAVFIIVAINRKIIIIIINPALKSS